MALFGSKKNTPAKKVTVKQGGLADVVKSITTEEKSGTKVDLPVVQGLRHVLKRPRITEKAAQLTVGNVYTFDISKGTTKREVIQAMKSLYKVTPRRVAVVTIRAKMRRNARSGKVGMTGGGKKAYVYLKKGETITIG